MSLLKTAERVGRRALMAHGVKSRTVPVQGGALHLYEAPGRGSLPDVVILHGIGSAATPFAPVIQRLRRHHRRVLALDAPGHGFSPAPTGLLTPGRLFSSLAEALDRELREPAILLGNSLGGGMALRYALERPARIRGLVLSSPAGAPTGDAALREFLGSFHMRTVKDARDFLGRLYHQAPWFMPLLAPAVQGIFAQPQIRDLIHSVQPDDFFTPQQLRSVAVPLLLLWGRSERLMPSDHLRYFQAHLPGHALIEEPEDFGHCPHLDRPSALARRITAFASDLPGALRAA